ncbi:hypothetical protein ACQHIV_03460 [Kribbella sp. GL6]|uniref:hypothetical protein n=1 Tax=Kribbella sp. GL6 TaxID=3419765 RepID=UPI003D04621B
MKRVALVAERNAPVRLAIDEDSVTLDAGSGDEAQASESLEARVVGDPVTGRPATRNARGVRANEAVRRPETARSAGRLEPAEPSGG